jgi:hypothetical protein
MFAFQIAEADVCLEARPRAAGAGMQELERAERRSCNMARPT